MIEPKPLPPGTEPELFDTQLLRQLVGFVFRGVRRHRFLAALSFLIMVLLGSVAAVVLPRTFHVESRLLANNNDLIRALGNPRSSLPSEDPTRAARELVFAHDNLVSLIKQTNLMKNWEETRPGIVKVKDQVVNFVAGEPTEEDRIDAMVGLLEKKLQVGTDQQTVTISIDWHDAQMAYLLVETAQQNFLETRHVTEMTAISEALSILEMHGGQLQKMVDDALHELERVRDTRRKGSLGAPGTMPGPESGSVAFAPEPKPVQDRSDAPSSATEQELAQLKFLLNSKKRALGDLEDFRSRRVTELTAQLQEQKVQYADQHPIVMDMRQRIQALKLDSPQMSQVKGDIDALEHEYRRKGGRDPEALIEPSRPRNASMRRAAVPQMAQAAMTNSELADDPLVEFSRNNLRVAAAKYEELLMRIDSARIEQDTTRAAFKYRYSVVRPASVPKKPVKPDVAIILGVTGVLAFFTALMAGALRDWVSGRLVEPWQVERALGLPVLSQVKLP
ncbi:MAG: hypothetical protein Q8N23_03105 [Archangium sp.]|nr:hypothetical protein [Archangium sp.]MDP3151631.1 hypothetical protein [Archangium sp.]MDP3569166.1 hypothetical protein [Archangium sp.]